MLPLSRFGRVRAPWQPTTFARLPYPSVQLHCWNTFVVGRVWLTFRQLSPTPVQSFSPCGNPSVDRGLTTLLSITLSRCRPTASSVCTLPLGLRVDKDPLAATPGSHNVARCRAFRLSADDFPRARTSVSIARLSTSRFSGPRGPGDEFGLITSRILGSACYPC